MDILQHCKALFIENDYQQLIKDIKLNPELIFTVDRYNSNLLVYSASQSYDCSVVLVEAGVPFDVKDNHGWTPLMSAVVKGKIEIATYLFQKKAIATQRNRFNQSAFDLILKHHTNLLPWFKLVDAYQDRFNEEDLLSYRNLRLPALFK
jgi:ankyrin repeat protein